MNEDIYDISISTSEKNATRMYEKIKNGEAYCHFTKESISIDNLYAVFTMIDSEYKFCSNSDIAINLYEIILNEHFPEN